MEINEPQSMNHWFRSWCWKIFIYFYIYIWWHNIRYDS